MVKEFKIILNTPPNQVYFPGSEVSGTLVVQVEAQPKSYQYIRILLHGRAHVHWSESHGSGEHRRTESYTSNEVYVDTALVVWSKEQSPVRRLEPGNYNFPFRFALPPALPSSFHGSVGFVRYTVEGRIGTGALKFDHVIQAIIPIVEVVNVHIPTFQVPVRQEVRKTVCCLCCASGPITLTVQIPRTGYCIGEQIPLNVEVENGSNRRFRLRAFLEQNVIYTAQGRHRSGSKQVIGIASDDIQPGITTAWNPGDMKIPTTMEATMTSCRIINILYFLKVTAVIQWSLNAPVVFPITIGNVPAAPSSSHPVPSASAPIFLPPPQPLGPGAFPPPQPQGPGAFPPPQPLGPGAFPPPQPQGPGAFPPPQPLGPGAFPPPQPLGPGAAPPPPGFAWPPADIEPPPYEQVVGTNKF